MEHRIERAGADPIAMPTQFLDHPMAIKVASDGMMQNVQPNHACEEFLVLTFSQGQGRSLYRLS
jgi:hypothetical protein